MTNNYQQYLNVYFKKVNVGISFKIKSIIQDKIYFYVLRMYMVLIQSEYVGHQLFFSVKMIMSLKKIF